MAEWSKAAVLKTVDPKGSQGSNPCLSANNKWAFSGPFLLVVREDLVRSLRFDKFAGSEFERAQHSPAGVEGRKPGIIPRSPPYFLLYPAVRLVIATKSLEIKGIGSILGQFAVSTAD